jgi:hypothetical protein
MTRDELETDMHDHPDRLLNNNDTATFMGIEPRSLNNLRSADKRRIDNGEEPVGPRWVTIRGRPFYRLRDLQDWVNGNAVEYGKTTTRPWLEEWAAKRRAGRGEETVPTR